MLWIIAAGLTALAVVAVVAELLTAAGWSAAAATVEQAEQVDPATGEGSQCDALDQYAYDPRCPFYDNCLDVGLSEPYTGHHRAADPEATTVRIVRAAYWPPAADLVRPYATTGGAR